MGVLEMRSLNCEIYKHAAQLGDLERSKAQKLADVLANDFDGVSNDDVIGEFNKYYEMNSDKRDDRIVLHLKPMFREKYRCIVR